MTTTHPATPSQRSPSALTEAHGPIDYLLIEFSRDRLTGEAAPAWRDLVDRAVIRLLDPPAPPGGGAAPAPDLVTQLRGLAELRDQGILTEEEFAAQKAKVLG